MIKAHLRIKFVSLILYFEKHIKAFAHGVAYNTTHLRLHHKKASKYKSRARFMHLLCPPFCPLNRIKKWMKNKNISARRIFGPITQRLNINETYKSKRKTPRVQELLVSDFLAYFRLWAEPENWARIVYGLRFSGRRCNYKDEGKGLFIAPNWTCANIKCK